MSDSPALTLGGSQVKFRLAAIGLSASLLGACSMGVGDAPSQQDDESIIRAMTEKHFPQAVLVRVTGFSGTTQCSGTYFDRRMVLTAAHCTRSDAIPGQTFIYFGDDYNNDKATLPNIPDPGKKSEWARVETTVVHP